MDATSLMLWAVALLLLALAALGLKVVLHLGRPHPPSSAPWTREMRRALLLLLLSGQGGLQLLLFFLLTGFSWLLLDQLLYHLLNLLCPLLLIRASILYFQSQDCGGLTAEREAQQRTSPEAPAQKESLRQKAEKCVLKSMTVPMSLVWFYLWTVAVGELVGFFLSGVLSPYLVFYPEFSQVKPSGYEFSVVAPSETNPTSELLVGLRHKVSSAIQPVVIRGVILNGLQRDISNMQKFLMLYSEAQLCVFYLPLLLYTLFQILRLRRSIVRIYGVQPNETRTVTEAKPISLETASGVHKTATEFWDTKNEANLNVPVKQTTLPNPERITDQEAQTAACLQHSQKRNETQYLPVVETGGSREQDEEEEDDEDKDGCRVCLLVAPYLPLATLVMLLQGMLLQPLWEGFSWKTRREGEGGHVPFLQCCALVLPAYCALCFTFHAALRRGRL